MPVVKVSAQTAASAPVADVHVALYTLAGDLVGSGISDGVNFLDLGTHAAATYEVLVTPPAWCLVTAGMRQTITVSGTTENVFDITLSVDVTSAPTDAHVCRCTGYFVDSFNRPLANMSVQFRETTLPNLLYYASSDITRALLPMGLTIRTDAYGKATVDLLRGQTYSVLITGYENIVRDVQIPDTATAPLPDVLFPVIAGVLYKDGVTSLGVSPAVSIATGATLALTVTTVFRSGVTEVGFYDVSPTSSDNTVLTILLTNDVLTLQAIAPGSATVEVIRSESSPEEGTRCSPVPPLYGSITVTVT